MNENHGNEERGEASCPYYDSHIINTGISLTKRPSHQTHIPEAQTSAEKVLLWDRKTEGGFPETKVLKQRVRDRIDPKRDLGHSDVGGKKKDAVTQGGPEDVKVDGRVERAAESMVKDMQLEDVPDKTNVKRNPDGSVCEDCR